MKNIFSFFVIAFLSTVGAFALDAPESVSIDNITQTSVDVSWENVEGSLGYVISYGTQSGNLNLGGDEVISEPTGSLVDLSADTQYYLSVTAFDEQAAEFVSETVSFQTLASIGAPLELSSIEVTAKDSLTLGFNTELNALLAENSLLTITTVETGEDITIASVGVNPEDAMSLDLVLDSSLLPTTNYEVVVIDVTDVHGRNIESGVDGVELFITPELFPQIDEETVEVNVSENDEISETVDLNSADQDQNESTGSAEIDDQNDEKSLGGQEIAEENIAKNAASVGAETEQLPDTGPQHVFLFALSLLFAVLLFVYRRRA
ncbi:fibronectin type III domain-containing protein [Candidatus Gracilibacteria bacterium]|nr:fibronectin type III domain-containing protein [Candidatus Gracilibacteria bacterium]